MTPHFTATELGITAATPPGHVAAMERVAWCLLEPVRAHVGGPVRITDGWRPPTATYGSPTSQHKRGEAVDLWAPDLVALWRWIAFESGLPFGQCILERRRPGPYTWIHLSSGWPLCERPLSRSRQVLVSPDGASYVPAGPKTTLPA